MQLMQRLIKAIDTLQSLFVLIVDVMVTQFRSVINFTAILQDISCISGLHRLTPVASNNSLRLSLSSHNRDQFQQTQTANAVAAPSLNLNQFTTDQV